MTETLDTLGEFAIGPACALIDVGELAGAAGVQIALENIGGEIVVAQRPVGGGTPAA